MRRYILTLLLAATYGFAIAQTDSLDIKLKHYKQLYDSSLIDESEYKHLKSTVIGNTNSNTVSNSKQQIFNFRVAPYAFFDVYRGVQTEVLGYPEPTTLMQCGGIIIQSGPAIKKHWYPNLGLCIEANSRNLGIGVLADVNYHILKGKYSPYIHGGGGYMAYGKLTDKSEFLNGVAVGGGIGANFYVKNSFSIAVSPEYRFVYYKESKNTGILQHQIGFRLAFVFY